MVLDLPSGRRSLSGNPFDDLPTLDEIQRRKWQGSIRCCAALRLEPATRYWPRTWSTMPAATRLDFTSGSRARVVRPASLYPLATLPEPPRRRSLLRVSGPDSSASEPHHQPYGVYPASRALGARSPRTRHRLCLVDGAPTGRDPAGHARAGRGLLSQLPQWLCAPKGAAFLHVRRDRQERIAWPSPDPATEPTPAVRTAPVSGLSSTGRAPPTRRLSFACLTAIIMVGGLPGRLARSHGA